MRTWLAISAVFPCFIVVVACADEEPAPSTRPGGRTAHADGTAPRGARALDMCWNGSSWVLERHGDAREAAGAAC